MKKYFVYELKKSSFTIACLTVIISLIYLVIILSARAEDLGWNSGYVYLWFISGAGGVLAFTVPFHQLEYKMKKRSADLFFSLPLSHSKIITVKYVVGLALVFIPYTVAFWLGAFALMVKTVNEINSVYYIAQFFASVIPLYIIYAVSSFTYSRANKANDGVLFAAFWALAPMLVMTVLDLLVRSNDGYNIIEYIYPDFYNVFSPLDVVTDLFQNLIVDKTYAYQMTAPVTANMCVAYTLLALTGAGATAGLLLTEKRAKFENIGQISESPFGYKVMIPLFTVCLMGLFYNEILLIVLVTVAMFLLTAVYKRSLKIGKRQAIIFAATFVAGCVLAVIISYVY